MLIEAKSNLARLMATENLVVEERKVETAYFDIASRVLVVPILNGNLSPELYDLLLGHEVGHALETPAEGWHDSVKNTDINKSILNVCEDARIEKKIKRKFPGLKLSFIKGYRELAEMDFFGTKGVDLDTLNFIDRVNMHIKGGASLGISFTDEELELLHEVENTETWPEVVVVARKIQEFMKKQAEKELAEETSKTFKMVGNDEDLEDAEQGEEIDIEDGEADDIQDSASDNNDEPASKSVKSQVPGTMSKPSDLPSTDNLASKTDETFRKKERELHDKENKKEHVYCNIPETIPENMIIGYSKIINKIKTYNEGMRNTNNTNVFGCYNPEVLTANYINFKNESNKIVSYLVKEFDLRKNADQQNRAKVSKTGELDMNKVFEYKLTDDIFKRMTTVPNGKSHGLVMFIDWSGSMVNYIEDTIRQLLNLVMFCKKVNIPFEVYAFTSTRWFENDTSPLDNSPLQVPKIGDLKINDFALLNLLSSRMTAKEYTDMAKYLLDYGTGARNGKRTTTTNYMLPEQLALGGTPLNAAIVSAFDIVPKFQSDNRLQIVNTVFLTDGESSHLLGRYAATEYSSKNLIFRSENLPTSARRVFIRDQKTKAYEEVVGRSSYGAAVNETVALLKLLKQRCKSNLIGFFISNTRGMSEAFEIYSKDDEQMLKWKEQFRKEGHVVVTNGGYDEYYLIRSESMKLDENELEVNTRTTRGFVNAFSKYTGNKVHSRVILNRFIGLIA